MDDESRNYYNTFVRVRDFGDENVADFKAGTEGANNFGITAAQVKILEQSGAKQISGVSVQTTRHKSITIAEIRADIRTINKTARSLAVDNPAIADLFRMPAGNNEQTLLAAARAFLTNATPLEAQFIAFDMPVDFLTDLQNDIAEFEQSLTEQSSAIDGRVSATAAIGNAVKTGLDALRRLRAIVTNKYRDNPAKLAAWTSASHVTRPPKKKKEKKTPTP